MKYSLAIDIGASSGRHILGWTDQGKLRYEEIHRFKNGFHEKDGMLCWDLPYLFNEIKLGLKISREMGKPVSSIGIDTWGVDFVLLDKHDSVLGNTVSYRDTRTMGIPETVYRHFPRADLYSRTGIQELNFNTIFQLYSVRERTPDLLRNAETFLMIPDYFNFLLTGKKTNEYTNATTTGLFNAREKQWDDEIISTLGYPRSIFLDPAKPGSSLGPLLPSIAEETGVQAEVILAPSHDTASAVLASAYAKDAIYISSGTWSLMGVENAQPITDEASLSRNFTNEGGFDYRYRYLKNIMGLWMLQSVKAENRDQYGFNELADMAEKNRDFPALVDVLDASFLSPSSMTGAVQSFCKEHRMKVPGGVGEVAAVIYNSLAESYKNTASEIEEMTGRTFDCINIVGGGCKDSYLNRLTAEVSGKRVVAGPSEATALGNILAQMIAAGELSGADEARQLVRDSFSFTEYK